MEVENVYKVGELVRWRCPLDADYSYGYIVSIRRNLVTVIGTGYYRGVTTEVHIRYIEKVKRGGDGCGGCKRNSKRSTS